MSEIVLVSRDNVVAAARTWLGVPWRHQGRNELGIDCIGLLVMVCKTLGLSDYDIGAYGRAPDPGNFLPHFIAGGAARLPPSEALDGDVLVFRQNQFPLHAGIRTTLHGVPHIVHASAGIRKVVEEPLTAQAPIVACFRLPGVV